MVSSTSSRRGPGSPAPGARRPAAPPPVPEAAEDGAGHPIPEVAAALARCREAGMVLVRSGTGPSWGWVECPTGARRIAVPARPVDPGRHGARLMIFLEAHVTHRPRGRRRTVGGGER